MNPSQKGEFGRLFKKFRLRSEFETLSQFGNALAEIGLIHEDSTYSRWENGSRIPKERNILIVLIELFVKRGGIKNIQEANAFLEAAGHGYLTNYEVKSLPIKGPFQVPREISFFTGRKRYLFLIRKQLLKGGVVLIHGIAGCGKTALTIKLAHQLREYFPDGVLWFRLDNSSPLNILISVAKNFGEDITQMQDVYTCASYVRSLLSSKKVLMIFDNAKLESRLDLLLPNSKNNSVVITSRNENVGNLAFGERVPLKTFTENETISLFKKILGDNYVKRNESALLKIGNLLGQLPLAINLIAQQLVNSYITPKSIIKEICERKIKLSSFIYENRDLYTAISLSYDRLAKKCRTVFVSLGIFGSKDFSLQAVSYINKMSTIETKNILQILITNSLVEQSSVSRYRLHPVIKFFIKSKKIQKTYYERAAIFYINLLEKYKNRIDYFFIIQPEIFNIVHIFESFINKLKPKTAIFDLWRKTCSFLWYSGFWDDFYSLNKKVYRATLKTKNKLLKTYVCVELSTVCYWRGELSTAEKYAKEGLKTATTIKNRNYIGQTLDRLGKIYQLNGDFKKSFKYFHSAYNSFSETDEYEGKGNVFRHIGEGYLIMKNLDAAAKNLNLALKKYLKIKDISMRYIYQALINSHLGIVLFKQNKLASAEKLFLQSLEFEKRAGGRAGTKIGSKLGLGLIYEIKKQKNRSKQYFKDAKKELETLGIKKQVEKLNVGMSILKDNLFKSPLYNLIFHPMTIV